MQEHVRGPDFYAEMNRRRDFGVVRLIGNVNTESIFCLLEMMETLVGEYYNEIVLEISSPGGELAPLQRYIASVDQLRKRNIRLITQGYDQVASAAAIILSSGDVRLASGTCLLLYHSSRLPSASDVTARNAKEIAEGLGHLDKWMTQVLLKQTGLNEEIIFAEVDNESPIDPKKAECLNFIDKVGDYREQADLDQARSRSRESFQDILDYVVKFPFPDGVAVEKGRTIDCEAHHALDYAIGRLPKALDVAPIRAWTDRKTAAEKIREALNHERGAVVAEQILRNAIGGGEPGKLPARQDEAVPPQGRRPEDDPHFMRVPQFRDLIPPHGAIHQREIVRHFLALGETGSGKTKSMIEPILEGLIRFRPRMLQDQEGANTSLFVVDPKAELYDQLEAIVARMAQRPDLVKVSLTAPDADDFDSMQRILVNFDTFPDDTTLDERGLPRDTATFERIASRVVAKAASLDPNNILNPTTGPSGLSQEASREIGYLLEAIVESLIWFRRYPDLVADEWQKIDQIDLEEVEKLVFQGTPINDYFSRIADSTVYARCLENARENPSTTSNGPVPWSPTPHRVTDDFTWLPGNNSVANIAQGLAAGFQDMWNYHSGGDFLWDSPPAIDELERLLLYSDEEPYRSKFETGFGDEISILMDLAPAMLAPSNEIELVNGDYDFVFWRESCPVSSNIDTLRRWRSLIEDERAAPSLCARLDKEIFSIVDQQLETPQIESLMSSALGFQCSIEYETIAEFGTRCFVSPDSEGVCNYRRDARTWIEEVCTWWANKSNSQRRNICASIPLSQRIDIRRSYKQHLLRLRQIGVGEQSIPGLDEFSRRVHNSIMLYFCGFVWTLPSIALYVDYVQTSKGDIFGEEVEYEQLAWSTLAMDARTWRFSSLSALPNAKLDGLIVVQTFKDFDIDFTPRTQMFPGNALVLDLVKWHQGNLLSDKWKGVRKGLVEEHLFAWLRTPQENVFSIIARWIYPLFSRPKDSSSEEQGENANKFDTAAGPALQKIVTSLKGIRGNFSDRNDDSDVFDDVRS